MVEGEGFEPSKAEPSDLQSDPFGRSGTPPNETEYYEAFFDYRQIIERLNQQPPYCASRRQHSPTLRKKIARQPMRVATSSTRLRNLLNPSSIAVIGALENPEKFGEASIIFIIIH